MQIVIRPDRNTACATAASLIASQLNTKPASVLGLATGRTMESVYDALVDLHEAGAVGFSAATSFNLDEYLAIAPDDPRSYRSTMDRLLFDRINIDLARTHVPHGSGPGSGGAAYEALIRDAGGIDLQLLGIGENGHIGFNEPLSSIASRTREVTLAPATRRQNAALFDGDEDAVPKRAITMGIATVLEARRILLVVTGRAKAGILARAVEGPVTAMIGATALHFHPDCLVVADEDAAGNLAEREYYDAMAAGSQEP